MKNIGVYIHIPFCNNICPYCDFYSEVKDENQKQAYTKALINSVENHPFGDLHAQTVYFGGGTPSCMQTQQLVDILNAVKKKFFLCENAEISLEANPESVTLDMFESLKEAGFNRVSFGVQSLEAKELKALGRIHDEKQAEEAVIMAQKTGFKHISADLMMGVPHQTQKSLIKSINTLSGLPLDHISAYMLTVEDGTPFSQMDIKKDCLAEDEITEAYLEAVKVLEKNGFMQYEISNFAKTGGESKHNLKYWNTEEYIGFGPSAHSYFAGKRFSLPSDIGGFIACEGNWDKRNIDSSGGDYAEYGMLKLRLSPGLDLDEYAVKYPEVSKERILAQAKILQQDGFVEINGSTITFTPGGFLLSNYLIAQLLFC